VGPLFVDVNRQPSEDEINVESDEQDEQSNAPT
jgi:hypothetical protein